MQISKQCADCQGSSLLRHDKELQRCSNGSWLMLILGPCVGLNFLSLLKGLCIRYTLVSRYSLALVDAPLSVLSDAMFLLLVDERR